MERLLVEWSCEQCGNTLTQQKTPPQIGGSGLFASWITIQESRGHVVDEGKVTHHFCCRECAARWLWAEEISRGTP